MEIVTFVELDIGGTTFRFGYASEESDYEHIPSLKNVSVRPAVIDPGESIGERETVTISFVDHLHRFDVDDFNKGTFWTKFRARYVTVEGAPLRVLRGIRGQELAAMDTYLYSAESLQISRSGATIVAKDPLTMLNAKSAQAPRVTQGELATAIGVSDMAFTLTPVGIGDLEYPAAGKGVLGGSEVVSFTRVGDNITLTSRGEGMDPQEHDEGTKFQLALVYTEQQPSAIVYDLLTKYTTIDPAWITLSDWQSSVDAFMNRVYTAVIAEPTSVKKLLDELCEQIGLVFFWDPFAKQIRLRPLVSAATSNVIDENVIVDGSFNSTEQPDKRVSQVWTYYGQRDPTKKLDETNNYRRVSVRIAPNEGDFTQPAIRKIFSRWINFPARATAERLNELIIARYQLPPRKFRFSLFRNIGFTMPPAGSYMDVNHWFLVDSLGDPETLKAQAVSVTHADDKSDYEAEEVRFAGVDLGEDTTKYVFLEGDLFNVNLRNLYNQVYAPPNDGDDIIFVVEAHARVGSTVRSDPSVPAMNVGDWPEAVNLTLRVNGRVQGIGGTGGSSISGRSNLGTAGGLALYTRRAITIENNGSIWGGGGGGSTIITVGSGFGGGGSGFLPGWCGDDNSTMFFLPGGGFVQGTAAYRAQVGSIQFYDGTEFNGGIGQDALFNGFPMGFSSSGGGPGQPGNDVPPNTPAGPPGAPGGAAGVAIDGVSFVTFAVVGDVRGPQIN